MAENFATAPGPGGGTRLEAHVYAINDYVVIEEVRFLRDQ
jgi:hypothetical protein